MATIEAADYKWHYSLKPEMTMTYGIVELNVPLDTEMTMRLSTLNITSVVVNGKQQVHVPTILDIQKSYKTWLVDQITS